MIKAILIAILAVQFIAAGVIVGVGIKNYDDLRPLDWFVGCAGLFLFGANVFYCLRFLL